MQEQVREVVIGLAVAPQCTHQRGRADAACGPNPNPSLLFVLLPYLSPPLLLVILSVGPPSNGDPLLATDTTIGAD